MKRYKQGNSFFIDCHCCGPFVADAAMSELIKDAQGAVTGRRWECPKCGQLFMEAVEDPIILETYEQSAQ